MKILKFGGNSLSTGRFVEVLKTYLSYTDELIIVASTSSQTTDSLISLSKQALQGDQKYPEQLKEVEDFHFNILERLLSTENTAKAREALDELFLELKNILRGVSLVREISPRTLDLVMSYGEKTVSCDSNPGD